MWWLWVSEWFEFAPWEKFSPDVIDGKAHFSGEFRFDGQLKTLLFRRLGSLTFFREASRIGTEWNFRLLIISSDKNDLRSLERALNEGRFRRIWSWTPPDSRAAVHVQWSRKRWSAGYGLSRDVSYIGNKIGTGSVFLNESFSFRFRHSQRAALEWPSSQVFAALQNEWANPQSELCFATLLASENEEARALHVFKTLVATPQEMAKWLRIALQAFHPRWNDAPNAMVSITPRLDARLQWDGHLYLGNDYGGHQMANLPPREAAIIGHLVRFYAPCKLIPNASMPLALRDLHKQHKGGHINISALAPSNHQRLEALLQLHEWTRKHWPQGTKHLERLSES